MTAGIAGSIVGAEILGRRGPLPWPGGPLWPVAAGLALVACGDVLSLLRVVSFGGAGLAVRIRAEERQLTTALGPESRHFAAERKRLVPGLW